MENGTDLVADVRLHIILFLFFTVLAVFARGKDAFNWTPKLRQSALVNVTFILSNKVAGLFTLGLILYLGGRYHAWNLPSISSEFWIGVPLWAKALAVLLVYDFNVYWLHRMLHKSWLWPTHAVHHSDTQMHFLSWSRGHFIEHVILFAGVMFLGSWLGLTMEEVALVGFIRGMSQYYVHSNLDWGHGFLKYIIVSPRMHRWHHANVEAAYDKNFASIFAFYDILFGTYYVPGSAKNIPTGFDNNPGDDFMVLFLYPFKAWGSMLKARFAKETPVPADISKSNSAS